LDFSDFKTWGQRRIDFDEPAVFFQVDNDIASGAVAHGKVISKVVFLLFFSLSDL
jgi:hypothetical protein